jgi:glycosyltransferase involved in cell wall biosynthesis
MKIAYLIPSYNIAPWSEEFKNRLVQSFQLLKSKYALEPVIVMVDDGSYMGSTQLKYHLKNFEYLNECEVLGAQHHINRGQGAALMTALEIARGPEVNADFFVTFDADGQHAPEDVIKLMDKLIENDLNIVFGNRFKAEKILPGAIPMMRKFVLKAATFFEWTLTKLDVSDAHNGFRIFDAETAQIMTLRQDRMAHATEIKQVVAHHQLKYGEAPVTIIYEKTKRRDAQGNINALNILRELFQGWLFR